MLIFQMSIYKRHRFPQEIIQHTVWLYYRSSLSFRDIEDLLAERSATVNYGNTWFLDEVFINIRGERLYFSRVVDQDGDVIDILVQNNKM